MTQHFTKLFVVLSEGSFLILRFISHFNMCKAKVYRGGRFLSPPILNLPKGTTAVRGLTSTHCLLPIYYSIKKGLVKSPLYELSDLFSEGVLSTKLGTPVDDFIVR